MAELKDASEYTAPLIFEMEHTLQKLLFLEPVMKYSENYVE